jgi:hypothetical protein
MNIQSLKDKLTIVIPSKNEGITLYNCIMYISHQNNIENVKIIIADISDNKESLNYIKKIKSDFKNILNIKVIKGGYPAQGRLNGSKLTKTPYILFIDADIYLTNSNIIEKCIEQNKDLITVPLYTDYPYKWTFRIFDIFQKISTLLGIPFAIGGFQLWNTKTYWETGGYNPNELFAEDYRISQKVKPKNFKVLNINGTYTSPRRFKNKGILWMFIIMIKSHINRNNPEFFTKSHNYWN